MPTAKNPAKVFDTFVVIPKQQAVIVCWPAVELAASQRELLSKLLAAMTYFGRAESWVAAELLNDFEAECNVVPLTESGLNSGQQLERVLAPDTSAAFATWRSEFIARQEAAALTDKQQKAEQKGKPVERTKLTPKDKQKIEDRVPATIFDALHAETTDLRKAGWNRPPGSRPASIRMPLKRSLAPLHGVRYGSRVASCPAGTRHPNGGSVCDCRNRGSSVNRRSSHWRTRSNIPDGLLEGRQQSVRPCRNSDHRFQRQDDGWRSTADGSWSRPHSLRGRRGQCTDYPCHCLRSDGF